MPRQGRRRQEHNAPPHAANAPGTAHAAPGVSAPGHRRKSRRSVPARPWSAFPGSGIPQAALPGTDSAALRLPLCVKPPRIPEAPAAPNSAFRPHGRARRHPVSLRPCLPHGRLQTREHTASVPAVSGRAGRPPRSGSSASARKAFLRPCVPSTFGTRPVLACCSTAEAAPRPPVSGRAPVCAGKCGNPFTHDAPGRAPARRACPGLRARRIMLPGKA